MLSPQIGFTCLTFCGMMFLGSTAATADDKPKPNPRFFKDEILDAMKGRSIGVDVVPLAQVRQEFMDGTPSLDDEDLKLTLQARYDIELKGSADLDWTHPLVPAGAKPCTGEGVVVSAVVSHGPAYDAGIRRGDVIYLIGGKKVATVEDFETAIQDARSQSNGVKFGIATYGSKLKAENSLERVLKSPSTWNRKVINFSPRLTRYVLLDPLERTPDAIKNNDLYTHKQASARRTPISMRLCFFRTISSKPDSLMLTVEYHGKSWIFMEQLTVRADDEVLEFKVDPTDRNEHINDDGSVDESVHYHFKEENEKKLLHALLTAKKVVARASGAKGLEEGEIELSERAKMEELYNIYKTLGGEIGIE